MNKILLCILLISTLFLSCSKKAGRITRISQLTDKRICVLTGSAGDVAARNAFPHAVFLDMVGSADAALAVKIGKADAFIYDKSVLVKILARNPGLIILDERISKLEVAAAVRKENTRLVSELNTALETLRKNGMLGRLRKKWVDTEYAVIPSFPRSTTTGKNGTLHMGTCAIYEPYTFQSNGTYTGYDIELSMLLADLLDKKIEIVDMTFESLIPALRSGRIDFALSNFTVTEERKKSIAYTVPYIENDISVLVNNE